MSLLYQFDAPDADLILVSNSPDATEFRVHSCILSAASPFFKDMFSLPQPSSPLPVSVIPVSELRSTLDSLLRFVYPIPDPPLPTLDALNPVLGAAIKYDFTAVINTLRNLLISPAFLHSSPSRVYAIACRYDLPDEARIASRHTLAINVLDSPLSDDLKYITAHAYHRLISLHRRRAQSALALLKVPEEVKCMQCNGSSYGVFAPPKWWLEFERRAQEELRVRPTTDVIFEIGFLARVANAVGCPRCPGSILDSYVFLEGLKKQIDELPSTVD
jgi:hypothetical protein